MSVPVTFPRNLPTLNVPVVNDDYVPLDGFLEGVATESFQVAVVAANAYPTGTVWVNNPGPKTPTTQGRYIVLMRAVGSPQPAICIGYLNVF